MPVGTIVRVPLHGRRVRGWVLDADVGRSPRARHGGPPARCAGSSPRVRRPRWSNLCRWAAWRWAGPVATFLRAASPPNVVAVDDPVERELAVYPGAPLTGAELRVVGPRDALRRRRSRRRDRRSCSIRRRRARAELVARLRDEGREVVTLGSEHPDAVRTREWNRARAGACVVVGGRTAVWAPVPDLAAVVVVDEGDEALEDERAPDVERARRRARARPASPVRRCAW